MKKSKKDYLPHIPGGIAKVRRIIESEDRPGYLQMEFDTKPENWVVSPNYTNVVIRTVDADEKVTQDEAYEIQKYGGIEICTVSMDKDFNAHIIAASQEMLELLMSVGPDKPITDEFWERRDKMLMKALFIYGVTRRVSKIIRDESRGVL